ncbi:hypothetical protein PR048_024818 [Dryococelus australis]|uniref:Uncharacterized protein n=1 Tax=Dryococelus australis TaxID=614101 RepID=A0ABQ9GPM8_9NEOP|nr:hypothetical protein PR048_024818 [Dryococelus australis]
MVARGMATNHRGCPATLVDSMPDRVAAVIARLVQDQVPGAFPAFETYKRESDKGENATHISYTITTKRKALNWRAVFFSHCVYLWDFQRAGMKGWGDEISPRKPAENRHDSFLRKCGETRRVIDTSPHHCQSYALGIIARRRQIGNVDQIIDSPSHTTFANLLNLEVSRNELCHSRIRAINGFTENVSLWKTAPTSPPNSVHRQMPLSSQSAAHGVVFAAGRILLATQRGRAGRPSAMCVCVSSYDWGHWSHDAISSSHPHTTPTQPGCKFTSAAGCRIKQSAEGVETGKYKAIRLQRARAIFFLGYDANPDQDSVQKFPPNPDIFITLLVYLEAANRSAAEKRSRSKLLMKTVHFERETTAIGTRSTTKDGVDRVFVFCPRARYRPTTNEHNCQHIGIPNPSGIYLTPRAAFVEASRRPRCGGVKRACSQEISCAISHVVSCPGRVAAPPTAALQGGKQRTAQHAASVSYSPPPQTHTHIQPPPTPFVTLRHSQSHARASTEEKREGPRFITVPRSRPKEFVDFIRQHARLHNPLCRYSNCFSVLTDQLLRGRGGVLVRLPASHLGEPGSVPGRSRPRIFRMW